MTDYSHLSKNRVSIMGAAALWIMLFHSTINIPVTGLKVFLSLGYLGVDIFMFMSGFSMFRSYKNCCCNIKLFWYKRIKKLIPSFCIFSIVWWASYIISSYSTFSDFIASISTKELCLLLITYRWFVPAIFLCYFITPLIAQILTKLQYKPYSVFLLILFFSILALPFVLIRSSVALMILIRVPEYIIGYYYGSCGQKESNVLLRIILLSLVAVLYVFLLGRYTNDYLCDTGLYWWPAMLIADSLSICLARFKFISNPIFDFMGKYSLELYLWHVFIMFRLISLFDKLGLGFDKYGLTVNVLAIVITCLFVRPYSLFVEKISGLIFKKKRSNERIS